MSKTPTCAPKQRSILDININIHITLVTFLVILFCFLSCNKPNAPVNDATDTVQLSSSVTSLPIEDFDNFYSRFYSDSVFQKSRLSFPLNGERIREESSGKMISEHWTASNWIVLKNPIQDIDTMPNYQIHGTDTVAVTHYKTSRQRSDTLVKEKVWLENSGFSFEIHYHLKSGRWFVIYCNEVSL